MLDSHCRIRSVAIVTDRSTRHATPKMFMQARMVAMGRGMPTRAVPAGHSRAALQLPQRHNTVCRAGLGEEIGKILAKSQVSDAVILACYQRIARAMGVVQRDMSQTQQPCIAAGRCVGVHLRGIFYPLRHRRR